MITIFDRLIAALKLHRNEIFLLREKRASVHNSIYAKAGNHYTARVHRTTLLRLLGPAG